MARGVSSSLQELSSDRALLLAAHYASEANVAALRSLAAARPDVFDRALLLAILLRLLPETLEPEKYVDFVDDVDQNRLSELDDGSVVDISPVQDVSVAKARSRAKHLRSVLEADSKRTSIEDYIIARAHRIEEETGLLSLIPSLVQPFLQHYPNLQTWYISNVLPLLRYQFEYYPEEEQKYTLSQIELADDEAAADIWLAKPLCDGGSVHGELARDLRGLVGPWIQGASARKRRRLDAGLRTVSLNADKPQTAQNDAGQEANDIVESWRTMFQRLLNKAHTDLPVISNAVEVWQGPEDMDVGAAAEHGLDENTKLSLRQSYTQAGLACIYASEATNNATISSAWKIVQVVSSFQDDRSQTSNLDQQLSTLPSFQSQQTQDHNGPPSLFLEHGSLLDHGNPLTAPSAASLELAKYYVLSARLFAMFGHPLSVTGVLKIRSYLDEEEQAALFQKITHTLSTGRSRSDHEWFNVQQQLLWLHDWGNHHMSETGSGVVGKIDRKLLEKYILEMLVHSGSNELVTKLYLDGSSSTNLSSEEIEQVIASTALQFYDSASNGNRTRGSMKKAFAIVTTFGKHFPNSQTFSRLQALIAATHAISSYSLTLQHGVPFTPVSIRVSSDPLSLIEKILAQNPGSYVKAQDLMSVASNFVAAGLTEQSSLGKDDSNTRTLPGALEHKKKQAQRRVIGMAIEAALQEDDFETAYSYVVNWLDTSATAVEAQAGQTSHSSNNDYDDDDIAWRAALAAGKHKSTSNSALLINSPSALRRLEQRMDLLSQALLLAPSHALPEILTAWRKCDEEMSSLLAAEAAAEDEDDKEQDIPGSFVDGGGLGGPLVQARREVGRGAAEEAPMGLFDVARGAAAAFSKSAFPLRGAASTSAGASASAARQFRVVDTVAEDSDGAAGSDFEHERVRKRDQLANAVTGGLASGIGWVLGANPVQQRD